MDVPTRTALDAALRRRAEMYEALLALEQALSAAASGRERDWCGRVDEEVRRLGEEFAAHVQVTEGGNGLYADILAAAPRLSMPIDRLRGEHTDIERRIASARRLLASEDGSGPHRVEAVRADVTSLMGRLVRHRQRGADLLFEAYEVDVGGSD